MIFIGGISQGMKALAYTGLITCSFCKSTTSCELLMTYYYFSFFFIPLFKWNKHFLVKMNCCDAVYDLNPLKGKAIARGEQVAIDPEDLKLLEDGKIRRNQAAGQEIEGADPEKTLRCPICKYEAPGDSNYCPKCGQRLR